MEQQDVELVRSSVWVSDADLKDRAARTAHKGKSGLTLLLLTYNAVGVIYGDIGTSPLYTLSSTFTDTPSQDDVMGVISLIFWTLTLIVMVKYVGIVTRADDHGEGGTFALYGILCRSIGISPTGGAACSTDRQLSLYGPLRRLQSISMSATRPTGAPRFTLGQWLKRKFRHDTTWQTALLLTSIVAVSMVLSDGVLTPAISVLSAVSGLTIATSISQASIIGITIAILVILFASQRFGTGKVGLLFAPIVCLWLSANAIIGILNLAKGDGSIFKAISPHYFGLYMVRTGVNGWLSLGGVMLCITGAEAMYADMGHFNREAVTFSFCGFVYPALFLTYFGQGAYLLKNPDAWSNVFWLSVPTPVFYPMLVLATLATVVASQALISGAFSIFKQSMAMGLFPPCRLIHTSDRMEGQVYIPAVNYILMVLCIAVVAGFQDTVALGHAYGVSVMSVMLLTTLMITLVMLVVWDLPLWVVGTYFVIYIFIEGVFLSANLAKIVSGGWVTILIAAIVAVIKLIWWWGGRTKKAASSRDGVAVCEVLKEGPHIAPASNGGPGSQGGAGLRVRRPLVTRSYHTALGSSKQQQRRPPNSLYSSGNGSSRDPQLIGTAPMPADGDDSYTKPKSQLALVALEKEVLRFPGLGIYYSDAVAGCPPVLQHVLENIPAIAEVVVLLTLRFVPVPRVDVSERFLVRRDTVSAFYHVVARYGYVDVVDQGPSFVRAMVSSIARYIQSGGGGGSSKDSCDGGNDKASLGKASRDGSVQSKNSAAGILGPLGEHEPPTNMQLELLPVTAPASEQLQLAGFQPSAPGNEVYRSIFEIEPALTDEEEPAAAAAAAADVATDVADVEAPLPRRSAPAAGQRPLSTVSRYSAATTQDTIELLSAVQQGVVYHMGKTGIRVRPESSWVTHVLIEDLYQPLVALSSSKTTRWLVPRDKLVELGMIVEV